MNKKGQGYALNLGLHIFYVVICILLFLLFSLKLFPSKIAEDGYIIFRYAKNIGRGYGFVWNVGDDWIWGSTSLIWTVILSTFAFFGFELVQISQVLGVIFGILLIIVIYFSSIFFFKVRRELTFFATLIVTIGHLCIHSLLGFETVLFSLSILINFLLSFLITKHCVKNRIYSFFLINGLLLSFIRPEGVIIVISTFISLCAINGKINLKKLLISLGIFLLSIFVIYGILYVVFGHFLPNPFYLKKSSSLFLFNSINKAIGYYIYSFLGMFLMIFIIRLITGESEKTWRSFWLFFPYLIFIISYFTIDQSMGNYADRFQYPIVPTIIVVSTRAFNSLIDNFKIREELIDIRNYRINFRSYIIIVFLTFSLFLCFQSTQKVAPEIPSDDKKLVGEILYPYRDRNYTMMLSEAGMLPYYSEWYVIDAWGLNDEFIALNGLNLEHIEKINPEIIQFHDYFDNFTSTWNSSTNSWRIMTKTLYLYAKNNNYTLACIIESWIYRGSTSFHNGYQWYFLRNRFPDFEELLEKINNLPVTYNFKGINS